MLLGETHYNFAVSFWTKSSTFSSLTSPLTYTATEWPVSLPSAISRSGSREKSMATSLCSSSKKSTQRHLRPSNVVKRPRLGNPATFFQHFPVPTCSWYGFRPPVEEGREGWCKKAEDQKTRIQTVCEVVLCSFFSFLVGLVFEVLLKVLT